MIDRRTFMAAGGACLGAGLLGAPPREVPAWVEVFMFGEGKPLTVPVRFSASPRGLFSVLVLDENGAEFARCSFSRARVEEALRGTRSVPDRIRPEGKPGAHESPCRLRARRGKIEVRIEEEGWCLVTLPAARVREALGEGRA